MPKRRLTKAQKAKRNAYHKQYVANLTDEQRLALKEKTAAWRAAHPEAVRRAEAKYRKSAKFKRYRQSVDAKRRAAETPEDKLFLAEYARLHNESVQFRLEHGTDAVRIEEAKLKYKGFHIRANVRAFFKALDATDHPEELLKSL